MSHMVSLNATILRANLYPTLTLIQTEGIAMLGNTTSVSNLKKYPWAISTYTAPGVSYSTWYAFEYVYVQHGDDVSSKTYSDIFCNPDFGFFPPILTEEMILAHVRICNKCIDISSGITVLLWVSISTFVALKICFLLQRYLRWDINALIIPYFDVYISHIIIMIGAIVAYKAYRVWSNCLSSLQDGADSTLVGSPVVGVSNNLVVATIALSILLAGVNKAADLPQPDETEPLAEMDNKNPIQTSSHQAT